MTRDARPAQHGAHAGYNFAYDERLRNVVVGADIQSGDSVFLAGQCRAEYDRSRFDGVVVTDAFCEVESAQMFHHYVNNEKRVGCKIAVKGFLCAIGRVYLIAFFLEVEFQNFAKCLFVVDDKNLDLHMLVC